MIRVSAVIAFLLLGIEEIGVQFEEPFGILPLGKHKTPLCMCGMCMARTPFLCLFLAFQYFGQQFLHVACA